MSSDDALDRDYADAGFGAHIGFGRLPAVLMVDFVNAYLDPASPLYAQVESTVEPARRVLEAARTAGLPVIYTVVRYGPDGRDGGVFIRKVKPLELFIGDGEMGQIAEGVRPRPDELVIPKQYPSAFFGTSLAATLTAAGVDTVIVMGFSTSGCVRATVVDAISHGFIPVVVQDAVGDRDPRPHEANLFDMQAKYADVLDAATVTNHLAATVSSGGHDA